MWQRQNIVSKNVLKLVTMVSIVLVLDLKVCVSTSIENVQTIPSPLLRHLHYKLKVENLKKSKQK